MAFSLQLPKSDRSLLLLLAAVCLITRLPFLTSLPFIQDEAIYAMMVVEQAHSPSLIPTLFGYPMSWKPPLFFWAYAPFSGLPIPFEAALRLPSLLFGLASLVPLYLLLRNAGGSRNLAFFSLLIFIFSMPALYAQTALLTDSLVFLFIAGALYLYSETRLDGRRFLAAGALAFLAFMTKHLLAAAIPLLAVLYIYFYDRKSLGNRSFLVSLLAVPAAFALHFLLLQGAGLGGELYGSELAIHLGGSNFSTAMNSVLGSFTTFFTGAGIWFALSLFGLWRHWKGNPFMALWYALMLFPLVGGNFMPWYYLPVMPAVAYFAALFLLEWKGKERTDVLFTAVLALALAFTSALILLTYVNISAIYLPQKEAGLMLAGKENVLIIGEYAPGIAAYKTLAEERSLGRPLDFGWILWPAGGAPSNASAFVADYHSGKLPLVDGSFTGIFTTEATFRKDSNMTSADYVAVVNNPGMPLPGFSIIYNESGITLYRK